MLWHRAHSPGTRTAAIHVRRPLMRLTLAILCLGSMFAASAHAHGPFPKTRRIVFHPSDPNVVLIEATYGLLVTRDAGAHWDWLCYEAAGFKQEDVLTANPVTTLSADGALLLASRRGLVRSADGCGFVTPSDALDGAFLVDLERDPVDAASALVLTANANADNGVFESTNDGVDWTGLGDPVARTLFESMATAKSDAMRLYLTSTDPISGTNPDYATNFYASGDRGATWDAQPLADADEDAIVLVLAVKPTNPDVVLLVDQFRFDGKARRILRSTDGGDTWEEIDALNDKRITAATWSDDGETLWIGGSSGAGLWKSEADGDALTQVNTDVEIGCLTFHDGELWACTNEFTDGFSIGRSEDGGATFTAFYDHAGIRGLLECDEDSQVEQLCRVQLLDLIFDLNLSIDPGFEVADAGASDASSTPDGSIGGKSPKGCDCAIARHGPSPMWETAVLGAPAGILLAIALRSRRRRR